MRRRHLLLLAVPALVATALVAHAANPDHGRVAAYDLATGALRFDVEAATASVHVHAIGSGVIVLTGADSCHGYPYRGDSMYAISGATGALQWGREYLNACFDYDEPVPTTHGIVPVLTRHAIQGWDTRDGRTRWSIRPVGDTKSSATTVEAVNSDHGLVTFLDGQTGRIRDTAHAPFHPTAWLLTPRIAVFVTQNNGFLMRLEQRLTALDIESGRRLWQRTVSSGNGFQGPAGDDRVVLLNWSGTTTHAYSVASGRPLWTHDGIAAAGAGLALSWDGPSLVALDLVTGQERWRATVAPGQIVAGEGSVAAINDTISVFDARTGAVRWTAPAPTLGAPYNGNAAIGAGELIVPAASPSYQPYVE